MVKVRELSGKNLFKENVASNVNGLEFYCQLHTCIQTAETGI